MSCNFPLRYRLQSKGFEYNPKACFETVSVSWSSHQDGSTVWIKTGAHLHKLQMYLCDWNVTICTITCVWYCMMYDKEENGKRTQTSPSEEFRLKRNGMASGWRDTDFENRPRTHHKVHKIMEPGLKTNAWHTAKVETMEKAVSDQRQYAAYAKYAGQERQKCHKGTCCSQIRRKERGTGWKMSAQRPTTAGGISAMLTSHCNLGHLDGTSKASKECNDKEYVHHECMYIYKS